jgi:putative ABC transport system substrate-binding protein
MLARLLSNAGAGLEMRRRELLLTVTALVTARDVRAQQKAMPVIGFLSTSPEDAGFLDPFRQGLSEIGYVEGDNIAMEYRVAHFLYDQFPALAADLVRRKVDVIVTANRTTPALAAKNATSTIPIVFTFVSDPVGIGLVASLARPGSNVTGFSNIAASLGPNQMELISGLAPQADAIAVLVNPNNPAAES